MAKRPIISRRNLLKAVPVLAAGTLLSNTSFGAVVKGSYSHLFKLSLNLYSFNSLLRSGQVDLHDMLSFCAENNFQAIDPTGYYFPAYPEAPSESLLYGFKRQAYLFGLSISGTGVRNDFVTPDAHQRKKDIQLVKRWIEVAAKMGSPNLRIFAGNSSHEGYSREEVFEWMAKAIRECCDYAADFGVMIALQNHNEFLKTAEDVEQVFQLVDSDWLGLNLDVGSYREADPYQEIKENIDRAITFQIKENVWVDGNETPTDFVRLFRIIKAANYRGYLPLETLGAGDPYQKVPQLLNKVKTALQQV